MNEQRLFEIASQTKLKGHDEKHCTFQNVRYRTYLTNSEYSYHRCRMINILIQGELLSL